MMFTDLKYWPNVFFVEKIHIERTCIFYCLYLLLTACQSAPKNKAEFYKWINDPAHGLIQRKSINGLVLTARYLPLEWQRLQQKVAGEATLSEVSPTGRTSGSSSKSYKGSYTFLISIQPDESNSTFAQNASVSDIMFWGISSQQEYKKRVMDLNFHAEEYFTLTIDGQSWVPALHTLENTYSTTKGRNLYLVFTPAITSGKTKNASAEVVANQKIELVFNDGIFATGISYFPFSKEAIEQVESLPSLSHL